MKAGTAAQSLMISRLLFNCQGDIEKERGGMRNGRISSRVGGSMSQRGGGWGGFESMRAAGSESENESEGERTSERATQSERDRERKR